MQTSAGEYMPSQASSPEVPAALTVGAIARRLGINTSLVQYYVRAYHITPIAIAGTARLFDETAVAQIQKLSRRSKREE